jgi:hypothetical protein
MCLYCTGKIDRLAQKLEKGILPYNANGINHPNAL